jgi:nucleotide-binding universal stress UspA family protein
MAAHLAERCGARLVIVHIVGHGPVPESLERLLQSEHLVGSERPPTTNVADVSSNLAAGAMGAASSAHRYQAWHAIGQQILAHAAEAARDAGAHDVTTQLRDGDAVEIVLERAQAEAADLIVMGSRGLSDLKGLLLGSVSHKICQLASCSCVTVK